MSGWDMAGSSLRAVPGGKEPLQARLVHRSPKRRDRAARANDSASTAVSRLCVQSAPRPRLLGAPLLPGRSASQRHEIASRSPLADAACASETVKRTRVSLSPLPDRFRRGRQGLRTHRSDTTAFQQPRGEWETWSSMAGRRVPRVEARSVLDAKFTTKAWRYFAVEGVGGSLMFASAPDWAGWMSVWNPLCVSPAALSAARATMASLPSSASPMPDRLSVRIGTA